MPGTRESLIKFIGEDLAIDIDDLNDDELLFSGGLVDSFALISLMTFIEGEFGFRISPADVNLSNFDSVERMVAFVDRNREGVAAGGSAAP